MYARAKIIVFLGPPGSGKGTQAARLSSALGIPAISTGEMLRRESESGSVLGKAVQFILAAGKLVSDELMNQVVARRLRDCDCNSGCVLDGYPRTASQARFLDRLLRRLKMSHPVVFHFDIPCEDVVARLGRRRQCAQCGRIFSVDNGLSCDQDGSPLIQRTDDRAAAIRERLRLYKQNADALVHYYRNKDYYRISATRAPEQIGDELLAILNSSFQPAEAVVRVKKHFYAAACLSRPL
jgi:adenylate kinase